MNNEQIDWAAVQRVKEVVLIKEQHNEKVENFLNLTSPQEYANLAVKFLDDVRLNFPKEFSHLNQQIPKEEFRKQLTESITRAYAVGYMQSEGLITKGHFADFIIYLNDHLVDIINLVNPSAKLTHGSAFIGGFTAVAVIGRMKAAHQSPS